MSSQDVRYRSLVYNFLADMYLSPIPTPGTDYVKSLLGVLRQLSDEGYDDNIKGVQFLRQFQYLGSFRDLESVQRELAVDRTWLCRGSNAPGTPKQPYEALYLAQQRQQDCLLSIANCYQEAGLALTDTVRERIDYIGVELAFMAYLCQKEQQYIEQGSPSEAEECRRRQRQFLTKHLLLWLPDYCKEIEAYARTDFFKGIGQLMAGFLQEESERLSSQI